MVRRADATLSVAILAGFQIVGLAVNDCWHPGPQLVEITSLVIAAVVRDFGVHNLSQAIGGFPGDVLRPDLACHSIISHTCFQVGNPGLTSHHHRWHHRAHLWRDDNVFILVGIEKLTIIVVGGLRLVGGIVIIRATTIVADVEIGNEVDVTPVVEVMDFYSILNGDEQTHPAYLLDGVGCAPDGVPTITQPVSSDHTAFHLIGGVVGGLSGGKGVLGLSGL